MVHKKLVGNKAADKDNIRYINNISKLLYTNVDGIVSKLLELKDYTKEKEPHIICLTETKLTPRISNDSLNLDEYNIWRRDRNLKKGGGIMILTKKELQVKEIDLGIPTQVELIAVEISTTEGEIIVANVYMPPKTNTWERSEYEDMAENTIQSLKTLLNRMEEKSKRIILTGDFNSNINWNTLDVKSYESCWDQKLLDLVQEFFLTQHVKENTRKRGPEDPSLLDLIFTRQENEIDNINYYPPFGKSDHAVLDFNFRIEYDIINDNQNYKRYLNYKKGNYRDLRKYFEGIDWDKELRGQDIDKIYRTFCDFYETGVQTYIPQHKEIERKREKWFNNRCNKAKEKRDLLWNRVRRHYSERAYSKYKQARNEYTRIRREAQRQFEEDIINKSTDQPKLFYNYIRSKTKIKDKIQSIMDEGKTYTNEEEICEVLNKKFQSVFTSESRFEQDENEQANPHILTNICITRKEVEEEMKKLDKGKANGPDEISNWVLRECADELSIPLHIIFRESIRQGKLPNIWKKANIVPLFKKGNRQNPLNYRPVSLTSIVGKILEKLIRKMWVNHLEKNNMLTEGQFGFRNGKSCVTNLLSYYDRVTETLQKRDGWVDSIYLDFKKAFDRVPHHRLLWKLYNHGGI